MIDKIEEILNELTNENIKEHTNPNIELKSDWSEEFGSKISSLGNKLIKSNRWLLIGVGPDGKLLSKSEKWARTTEETISQHINKRLDPSQTVLGIHCKAVNLNWIILIEIQNPGAVVYWNQKAYKSAGTTKEVMTPSEIMELTVTLPGLTDYSSQAYSGPVEPELITLFAKSLRKNRMEDSFLKNLYKQGQSEILNSLGIYGKNVSKILFGDLSFRLVVYDDEENPQINNTIKGLFKLLDPKFIQLILKYCSTEKKATRKPFSEKALKESLANAVAHAAYFESSGDIIVEIYIDKLIISNLCLPELGFFANKWFSKIHKTVNKSLMETLRLSGFVDELGRGKSLIFSESIKNGNKPPEIFIENSGRFNRWKLILHGETLSTRENKLYQQLKRIYTDNRKNQMAFALVLWRNESVKKIKEYIDGESIKFFIEVMTDRNGPVFYYKSEDKITLRRWAETILNEGKDTKSLTDAEEERYYQFCEKYCIEFNEAYITPKELRSLLDLGESGSAKTLSSNILKRWSEKKKISLVSKGKYKFANTNAKNSISEELRKLIFENK